MIIYVTAGHEFDEEEEESRDRIRIHFAVYSSINLFIKCSKYSVEQKLESF